MYRFIDTLQFPDTPMNFESRIDRQDVLRLLQGEITRLGNSRGDFAAATLTDDGVVLQRQRRNGRNRYSPVFTGKFKIANNGRLALVGSFALEEEAKASSLALMTFLGLGLVGLVLLALVEAKTILVSVPSVVVVLLALLVPSGNSGSEDDVMWICDLLARAQMIRRG